MLPDGGRIMGCTRPFPLLQMLRSFSVFLFPYSRRRMIETSQEADECYSRPPRPLTPSVLANTISYSCLTITPICV